MIDLAEDSGQDDRMLDRKVGEFLQEDGYNVMVTVKFEHFEQQHMAPCIITCLINYVKLMNIKYRLITCLTFKGYG
jgi:hypothetical protein